MRSVIHELCTNLDQSAGQAKRPECAKTRLVRVAPMLTPQSDGALSSRETQIYSAIQPKSGAGFRAKTLSRAQPALLL
jgi:hypothetical protein